MNEKVGIPVLVTGFGPFGKHKVNISWETAKALKTFNFEPCGINLIIEEIPVVYSIVSQEIPALWKKYKPQLVIHMGVTSIDSEISLETLAHKNGYVKVDILGELPEKGNAEGKNDVISTTLFLEDVCHYLNNSTEIEVPIHVSKNAGRYLCEFTYYVSLNIDNSRVVFIHIPDFDKNYSVMQVAFVVKKIILILLEQVMRPSVLHMHELSN